jgi:hypothetical protein
MSPKENYRGFIMKTLGKAISLPPNLETREDLL